MSAVTLTLSQIESGDPSSADRLLPLVYDELKKLAAAKLNQEFSGQTLQPTALVHEAYLRLLASRQSEDGESASDEPAWNSRGHFFAAAAEAMRRIVVDQARRKLAVRHGGGRQRVFDLKEHPVEDGDAEQTIIIHDLLDLLGGKHRQVQVAKMRLFLELTFVEIAEVMNLSADTAESDWSFARAWMKRQWRGTSKDHNQ